MSDGIPLASHGRIETLNLCDLIVCKFAARVFLPDHMRIVLSAFAEHIMDIVGLLSKPEVRRVHAMRNIAGVQYAQTFRNRSEVEFPRNPMCQAGSTTAT